jgi:hypothetical protein
MINVYPFASGSLYTASFALSSSYANVAEFLTYVETASIALSGSFGPKGLRGYPEVCTITYEQYLKLVNDPSLKEVCIFPPR